MAELTIETAQTPGEKVKALMKRDRFTQAKLAERLDCSENHISMIVRGKRKLTADKAKIIGGLFGVRFQWLLGYDDCITDYDKLVSVANANVEDVVAAHTILELAIKTFGYTLRECIGDENAVDETGVREFNPDEIIYCIAKDGIDVLPICHGDYNWLRDELVRYAAYLIEGMIHKANDTWHPFLITKEKVYDG